MRCLRRCELGRQGFMNRQDWVRHKAIGEWLVVQAPSLASAEAAIDFAKWDGVHHDLKASGGAVMHDGAIVRRIKHNIGQ